MGFFGNIFFSLKIKGDKEFNKNINKLIKEAKGPKKIMLQSAIFAKRDIDEHFRKEEGPDGAWPAFARGGRVVISKTGKIRIKKGKLLRKTGAMKNSITYQPKKKSLKIVSGEPYSKTHQEGKRITIPAQSKRGGKAGGAFRFVGKAGNLQFAKKIKAHSVKIPARPFIWLSSRFFDKIEKFIIRKFKRDMKK